MIGLMKKKETSTNKFFDNKNLKFLVLTGNYTLIYCLLICCNYTCFIWLLFNSRRIRPGS